MFMILLVIRQISEGPLNKIMVRPYYINDKFGCACQKIQACYIYLQKFESGQNKKWKKIDKNIQKWTKSKLKFIQHM